MRRPGPLLSSPIDYVQFLFSFNPILLNAPNECPQHLQRLMRAQKRIWCALAMGELTKILKANDGSVNRDLVLGATKRVSNGQIRFDQLANKKLLVNHALENAKRRTLIRMFRSGFFRSKVVLQLAVDQLVNVESFVIEAGEALKSDAPRGDIDCLILVLWDGFDIFGSLHLGDEPLFAFLEKTPPLSRWSGPAAAACISQFGYNIEYKAYAKKLERLFLRLEAPVLVKKYDFQQLSDSWESTVLYTPAGVSWYRKRHKEPLFVARRINGSIVYCRE